MANVLTITKKDQCLWSSHKQLTEDQYKGGIAAEVNGKTVMFVPMVGTKTPALRPSKDKDYREGYKAWTAVPYGAEVQLTLV